MLDLVDKPSGEAESNTRARSWGTRRTLEVVPHQVHVLAGVNFFFQMNSKFSVHLGANHSFTPGTLQEPFQDFRFVPAAFNHIFSDKEFWLLTQTMF